MTNTSSKINKEAELSCGKGGRRPTDTHDNSASANIPNPEATIRNKRRNITAQYKLEILEELDRCTIAGEKGAILRREGLVLIISVLLISA